MKRLIVVIALVVVAVPAFGFNTSPGKGDRVGVLHPRVHDRSDDRIAYVVSAYLVRELRSRGLDAFDARARLDDVREDESIHADYFVEVVSGDGDSAAHGGISVGGRSVGVDMALVVSRVAARMRLYDGRTLELIQEYDLQRETTTVLPTAIGAGGRYVAAWIALPIVHHIRYRAAARAVAQEAAAQIAVDAGK